MIEIYTDGACSGNPGPGGWSAIIVEGEGVKTLSGNSLETTNNRMELTGPIEALRTLSAPCSVLIRSDSRYLCDAFNQMWVVKWVEEDWITSKGKPVKNRDLWEILLDLVMKHEVRWEWVKGHSGHHYNELADRMAVEACKKIC